MFPLYLSQQQFQNQYVKFSLATDGKLEAELQAEFEVLEKLINSEF